MHEHIGIKAPALREFHFIIAEDLVYDGLLSMDDLVVRQGQKVSLVVKIEHREGQLLRNAAALVRLLHKVVERVIHPAKIPLIIKTEPALPGGFRSSLKGSGVLRDQHRGRMECAEPLIHLAQEFDGGLIFSAPLVAHPVDHPADRVHPETVKVILRQPVICCRLHEAGRLPAGINKVPGPPLAVRHVARGILIELRTVVLFQPVIIIGKMRRHEVHDCADPRIVQFIDQLHEVGGGPVAGRRSKKSGLLIAPAAVKRMLRERHELHMGKMELLYVGDQIVRDFIVPVPSVRIILIALPGSHVQFIDAHRPVQIERARLHPFLIRERILVKVPDDRREIRPQLHPESVGVAMLDPSEAAVNDIFIHLSRLCMRDHDLEKTAPLPRGHLPLLPAVKFSDDRHPVCVQREGAEEDSAALLKMRSEPGIRVKSLSLIKFLDIHLPFLSLLGFIRRL